MLTAGRRWTSCCYRGGYYRLTHFVEFEAYGQLYEDDSLVDSRQLLFRSVRLLVSEQLSDL